MPVFGLAALWNGSAPPERVASWVEGLGPLLPMAQSLQLVVALRPEDAGIELKVEAPGYPRAAVERLAEDVKRSGGTFIELWRMPKAERDGFRASTFGGGTAYRGDERAAAARALEQHLTALSAKDVLPVGPPPSPMDAAITSPARPPERAAPEAQAPIRLEAPASEPSPAARPQPHQVPTAPPGSPQRRGRRFAVKLELEFRTELDFVREHALNISNGGLFVRTAHRPQPDSVVTVDVRLPNGDRLQGDAIVVHVVDDPYTGGVGLAFLSDDATFAQTLDGYLASLAGGVG
ncbi:TIGR02266 family protein [Pyxidicoccus xibeiensis]|uniref:TIGR02266 family protein n=1 Tax=Pyxidicoccus xibeiensis TaxID=2906759 RepID=UPI0020A75275|nr:TIGR02266 family protein [Pyxidicoccus xibeiensis]MCP3135778.1 TIGR02266 family protein [Pyxidicoccus xibeiensis]